MEYSQIPYIDIRRREYTWDMRTWYPLPQAQAENPARRPERVHEADKKPWTDPRIILPEFMRDDFKPQPLSPACL